MKRRASQTNYKRRTKKTTGKKNYISYKKGYTALYLRKPTTVPDAMFVRLDYFDNVDSITGVSGTSDALYRVTSAFAPGITISGHQPLGFDQFAALYQRYRVLSCGIDVSIINLGSFNGIFGIVPNITNVVAFTAIDDVGEAVRSKLSKWIAPASRTSERLTHYATTREVMGLEKRELYDDSIAAAVTGNPVRGFYWHVVYHTTSGVTSYSMNVRITYYVEFYERNQLGPS